MEGPAVDPEADAMVPGGDADADVVGVGGEDPHRPAVELGQEEEVRALEDQEGAAGAGVRLHLDLLRRHAKETRRAAAGLLQGQDGRSLGVDQDGVASRIELR